MRGYLPFERFQPYGLLGIGSMYAQLRTKDPVGTVCTPGYYWGWWCNGVYGRLEDGMDFVAKVGGGMDIYITEDWGITLDATYVLPFDRLQQLRYICFNWGVLFKF